MNNQVMPIGKYKGMTMSEIESIDYNYINYMCSQSWFKDKYSSTYNLIINNINPQKNECTPVHNKLQLLFLKEEIQKDVAKVVSDYNNLLDLTINNDSATMPKWNKTYKNFIKPEFICFEPRFEISGFDVVLRYTLESDKIKIEDFVSVVDNEFYFKDLKFKDWYKSRVNDGYLKFHYKDYINFFIEIKPVIEDDFPNILRQIKNNIKKIEHIHPHILGRTYIILAYADFSVSNLSLAEVETFFKIEGILLYKINHHKGE